jgi:RNA polymerase sigma-70 factor (ECF subfamily)
MSANQEDVHTSRQRNVDEDDRLVALAKENREAFGDLYAKYWEPVYRFVYRRIVGEERVKDVAQAVFIKAMLNLHKYEPRGYAFSSWLFRIALNEITDAVKKEKSLGIVDVQTEGKDELVSEPDFGLKTLMDSTDDSRGIQLKQLVEALKQSSDEDVELIELRFFEKRRLKEVADILGISETNCKVRMHRTMKRLKATIEKLK